MKPGFILGTVALLAGSANADPRSTTVHVGGFGLFELEDGPDDVVPYAEGVGGFRMTMAWEPPPVAYPDQRGYRCGGALVPELIAGALMRDDRAEGMLGAGLRAELRIVQREGGLFRINSKSALYLAGRGMVVGKDRDVLLEGVMGDHLSFGNSPVRFGFEIGFTRRMSDVMEHDRVGFVTQFFLGYAPR